MKHTIYIALAVISLVAVFAFENSKVDFKVDTEKGIQFHKGSWNEALQLAKTENKLIFLDIYATWCGPCKRLKSRTFSNEEVGNLYNQTFINVALDGEKGEGLELVRKYKVRGYPTLLFIDANGNVVAGTAGYHSPSEFITLGRSIKNQLK